MSTIKFENNKLSNQQFIEQFQHKGNEISVLLEITKTILVSEDFEITAKKIFDSCKDVIGAKAGYVALLSDDGHENELLFLEDGGMPCTVNPNLPMPIRGLREQSYKTGEVVYDNDFMKSEWVKYMPKGHMDLKNVLFSPLNIDNKTVGIMGLACKEQDFNDNDARIAAAFGNYAAIALQNSRMLENLKSSNATKDKLFSIIAHDLKTPFNSLLLFSELLEESTQNEDLNSFKKVVKSMNNSIKQTYNLLNNLLDWSRTQSKRLNFSPTHFNFYQLIDEITGFLETPARLKELTIRKDTTQNMTIYADRNLISTVVRNILSNAIKYSEKGGTISVKAEIMQNNFMCKISDDGIGMSDDIKNKIFSNNDFNSKPGTQNENGTGLGLNICQEFVKIHNGLIGVDSIPGEGSVFWFKIPNQTIKK